MKLLEFGKKLNLTNKKNSIQRNRTKKDKPCDVTCDLLWGFGVNITLRDIGLRHFLIKANFFKVTFVICKVHL